MRFALIDRISAIDRGKSITAVKNLTLAEEYLADHFPGFPVMPGVLMVEAMVQAGAWLLRYTEEFAHSTILLKHARAVKFINFVVPGRTLTVTMEMQRSNGGECEFKGSGVVDGQSAVSGRLVLERFNLRDRSPELARSDEVQIQLAREQFALLWHRAGAAPKQ
jgi:3-hydroxyacyl-[acyl-carrier-protein] dehydratase